MIEKQTSSKKIRKTKNQLTDLQFNTQMFAMSLQMILKKVKFRCVLVILI